MHASPSRGVGRDALVSVRPGDRILRPTASFGKDDEVARLNEALLAERSPVSAPPTTLVAAAVAPSTADSGGSRLRLSLGDAAPRAQRLRRLRAAGVSLTVESGVAHTQRSTSAEDRLVHRLLAGSLGQKSTQTAEPAPASTQTAVASTRDAPTQLPEDLAFAASLRRIQAARAVECQATAGSRAAREGARATGAASGSPRQRPKSHRGSAGRARSSSGAGAFGTARAGDASAAEPSSVARSLAAESERLGAFLLRVTPTVEAVLDEAWGAALAAAGARGGPDGAGRRVSDMLAASKPAAASSSASSAPGAAPGQGPHGAAGASAAALRPRALLTIQASSAEPDAALPRLLSGRATVAAQFNSNGSAAMMVFGRAPADWLRGVEQAVASALPRTAPAGAAGRCSEAVTQRLRAGSAGVITVHQTTDMRAGTPSVALLCPAVPTCVATSSPRSGLVVVGTAQGSLCLWAAGDGESCHLVPGCSSRAVWAACGVPCSLRLPAGSTDVVSDSYAPPRGAVGAASEELVAQTRAANRQARGLPLGGRSSAAAPGSASSPGAQWGGPHQRFPGHRTAVVGLRCTGSDSLLSAPETLRGGAAGSSLGLRVLSLDRSGLLISWAVSTSAAEPAAAARYAQEVRFSAEARDSAGGKDAGDADGAESGPLALTSADGRTGSAGVPTSLRLVWTSAVDTCAGLPRPLSLLGGDAWGLTGGGVPVGAPGLASVPDPGAQVGDGAASEDLLWASGPQASLGDLAMGSSSALSLWESGDRVTCADILSSAAGAGGDVLVGTVDGSVAVLTAGGDGRAVTLRPAEPRQSRDGAALWAGMPATLGGGASDAASDTASSGESSMSAAVAAASACGAGSDAVALCVTAVAASTLPPHAVVTAMSDGSVALYASGTPNPAIAWPDIAPPGHAVCSVGWSPSRPAVFFTLDTAGVLRGWDLAHSPAGPSSAVSALREAGIRAKLGTGMDSVLRLGGSASLSAQRAGAPAAAGGDDATRPTVCVSASGRALLVALPAGVGAVTLPLSDRWSAPASAAEEQRAVASLFA